jgi:hypothetical protein
VVDRTAAGSLDSPKSRLAAAPVVGNSSPEAWVGEEWMASLVAASVGRDVVRVGLATKRSGRRCLELGVPALRVTDAHHEGSGRRRTAVRCPLVAEGGGAVAETTGR